MVHLNPDHLRLEIGTDPALPNLLPYNPSNAYGAFGWSKTQSAVTSIATNGTDLKFTNTAAGWTGTYASVPFPVTPGRHIRGRVGGAGLGSWSPSDHRIRVGIEYRDENRSFTSGTVYGNSAYTVPGTAAVYTDDLTVPATEGGKAVEYARLIIRFYGDSSGAVCDAGSYFRLTHAMVTESVSSISGSFDYNEPIIWTDVTGPTSEIELEANGLDVGSLAATIHDATLDPATADTLRPGQPVRLRAYDGSAWHSVGTYTIRTLDVAYIKPKRPGAAVETRISLTATDAVTALASIPQDFAVDAVADVRYLLNGAGLPAVGVPWDINGVTGDAAGTVTWALEHDDVNGTPADKTALTQVALVRDSTHAQAWIDGDGILHVYDTASLPASGVTLADDTAPSYMGIDVGYATDELINSVRVTRLEPASPSGFTAVEYGPYQDRDSVRRWGTFEKTFTIVTWDPLTHATGVLAANADPGIKVRTLDLTVRDLADVPTVLALEPCSTLDVEYDGTTYTVRVRTIKHTLEARRDAIRPVLWRITYELDQEATVAQPRLTGRTP